MELSLSVLEKYLLKLGFQVQDHVDPQSGKIRTRASGPNGWEVEYPAPLYVYTDVDRQSEVQRVLNQIALWLGISDTQALAKSVFATCIASIDGFICKNCGRCCTKVLDAYQGRVSPEELEEWMEQGNRRIFRLVERVERSGYSIYRAFINPKTHRYFSRCPFYGKTKSGQFGCRIHETKPLKCRAYPYSRLSAEYSGCRGFDHLEAYDSDPNETQP